MPGSDTQSCADHDDVRQSTFQRTDGRDPQPIHVVDVDKESGPTSDTGAMVSGASASVAENALGASSPNVMPRGCPLQSVSEERLPQGRRMIARKVVSISSTNPSTTSSTAVTSRCGNSVHRETREKPTRLYSTRSETRRTRRTGRSGRKAHPWPRTERVAQSNIQIVVRDNTVAMCLAQCWRQQLYLQRTWVRMVF